MIDLSIIIVSYNTKDLLHECIISIEQSMNKNIQYEIIVVDNNSSDGTSENIHKEHSKVLLITNKENYGFSKANNIGIKHAKGKYILFLNPDTVVYPNVLERLLAFMEENLKAGVVTCKLILPNGRLDDASHRGFPTPWNSFTHFSGIEKIFTQFSLFSGYHLGSLDLNTIHEIDACAGAFMLVRRTAGEEVRWWDEDYFWYGDDIDFCYRLKKAGWKIFFVPDVAILHYKGVSGGIKKVSKHITTATTETKKRSQKARFDAMRIFYEKHYRDKYPSIITNLVMLGIRLKQALS